MPARATSGAASTPTASTAAYTSFAKHPRTINGQPYITSWNNKQAPRLRGRRLEPLLVGLPLADARRGDRGADRRRRARSRCRASSRRWARPRRPTCAPSRCCRCALDVIGSPRDDALADAVAELRDWVASGSHRRDRDGDGRYEHADAIRILDAFWPLWMRAQFEPSLGAALFDQLVARARARQRAQQPRRRTSARRTRPAGTATRRRTCGACSAERVKAPYSKRYCGARQAHALPDAAARRARAGARRARRPSSTPTRRARRPASPATRRASTRSSSARPAASRSR